MLTAYPINGFTPLSLKALTIVALACLAPITASTAAASDTSGTAMVERTLTSAAIVELVPVQTAATVSAPVPEFTEAPSAPQETVLGRGSASYYAAKFDGRRTASGERFHNAGLTAAHRSLPFGSLVRVTSVASGKSVIVRINDRGPFTRGRMIDVSRAAAVELGLIANGHGTVELALVED